MDSLIESMEKADGPDREMHTHYLLGKAEGLLTGWLDPSVSIKRAEDASSRFLKARGVE